MNRRSFLAGLLATASLRFFGQAAAAGPEVPRYTWHEHAIDPGRVMPLVFGEVLHVTDEASAWTGPLEIEIPEYLYP